jgi:hypothetical protein
LDCCYCILAQFALTTGGGFHEPLMIEGDVSFGQYIRIMGRKSPFGAGNQLASLSLPGDCYEAVLVYLLKPVREDKSSTTGA